MKWAPNRSQGSEGKPGNKSFPFLRNMFVFLTTLAIGLPIIFWLDPAGAFEEKETTTLQEIQPWLLRHLAGAEKDFGLDDRRWVYNAQRGTYTTMVQASGQQLSFIYTTGAEGEASLQQVAQDLGSGKGSSLLVLPEGAILIIYSKEASEPEVAEVYIARLKNHLDLK